MSLKEQSKRIYGERADLTEEILSQELGEKYVDYRKKWIQASKRELVTDFPLYIQFEHLGRCNFRCPTCIHGNENLSRNYKKGFDSLDIGLYKKVLDEAEKYSCPSISFHNNDEPLLLADLEKRIKMAKKAGFLDLIITTNASLLTKERAASLLESGLTKINFSLDCWNKEDYEKIRIGGNFDITVSNISNFLKQKAGLKLPVTRATSVLTKHTYKDMDRFRKFWLEEIGVDTVEFQNFQALKGYTEDLKPEEFKIDADFSCNSPWQQVVIRPNGDVLPCCSFYGTGLVLGNIKDSSIYDLWHSNMMNRLRKELKNNNFDFLLICKTCSGTFYADEK